MQAHAWGHSRLSHASTAPALTVPQALCAKIASADAALVGVAGAPALCQVAAALPRAGAGAAEAPDVAVGGESGSGGQESCLRHGLLIVGPEGDFTPGEIEALLAAGAQPVGLGELRLRAETAAIALLSYVQLQLA